MKELSLAANPFEAKISARLQELKLKLTETAEKCKGQVADSFAGVLSDMKDHHSQLEARLAELRSTEAANTETVRKALHTQVETLTTQTNNLHRAVKHRTKDAAGSSAL